MDIYTGLNNHYSGKTGNEFRFFSLKGDYKDCKAATHNSMMPLFRIIHNPYSPIMFMQNLITGEYFSNITLKTSPPFLNVYYLYGMTCIMNRYAMLPLKKRKEITKSPEKYVFVYNKVELLCHIDDHIIMMSIISGVCLVKYGNVMKIYHDPCGILNNDLWKDIEKRHFIDSDIVIRLDALVYYHRGPNKLFNEVVNYLLKYVEQKRMSDDNSF